MGRALHATGMVLLLAASAHAATFTVTTDQDVLNGTCAPDNCSLRDAIIAANANANEDKILIPDGVYRITLVGADDEGKLGDYDIIHNVSIVGTGSSNVFIDGLKQSRIFDIFGDARVEIRKLAIIGGMIDLGAGIYVSQNASVDLQSVLLAGNTAFQAGAIYIESNKTSTMGDSVVQKNKASGLFGDMLSGGGAVYIAKGGLSVTKSVFSENEAVRYGGAFAVLGEGSSLSISDSSIFNNSASDGGAINNTAGTTLTITNSALYSNKATVDGGGALEIDSTATISTSTIFGNESKGVGGGILLQKNGVLKLTSVTLANNIGSNGGGIYVNNGGKGTLRNTIFIGDVTILGDFISAGHNLLALNPEGKVMLSPSDIQTDDVAAALGNFVTKSEAGKSHVPLINSPAINAGSCAPPDQLTDQLGKNWVGACDIGAIEALCGDGIVHSKIGDECDDGNEINTDACLSTCKLAKCGDGTLYAGFEVCDDGNAIDDDACPNTCKSPTCGDKIVQKGKNETCDDGNKSNADSCLNSCIAAKCGDGIVQKDVEDCDDGNVKDGDKCSAGCKVEVAKAPTDEKLPTVDTKKPTVDDKKPPVDGPIITVGDGKVTTDDGKKTITTPPADGGSGCTLIR